MQLIGVLVEHLALAIQQASDFSRYKTEISNFRRDADQFDDVVTRWEFMKYKCREYSRNYSIQMAKTRKRQHISLEKRVAELERLITSNSNDQLLKEYSSCKLELESLYEYITSEIIL